MWRSGETQEKWKVQVSKTFGKSSKKQEMLEIEKIVMTHWAMKRGSVELHEAMLIN